MEDKYMIDILQEFIKFKDDILNGKTDMSYLLYEDMESEYEALRVLDAHDSLSFCIRRWL